jgi:hypothetical protein
LVLNDLYKTEAVLGVGGIVIVDDFLHSGSLGVNEACNHYLRETATLTAASRRWTAFWASSL